MLKLMGLGIMMLLSANVYAELSTPVSRVRKVVEEMKLFSNAMKQVDGQQSCSSLANGWILPPVQLALDIALAWHEIEELKYTTPKSEGIATDSIVTQTMADGYNDRLGEIRQGGKKVNIGREAKAGDVTMAQYNGQPIYVGSGTLLDIVCIKYKKELSNPTGMHLKTKESVLYVRALEEKTGDRCEQYCIYKSRDSNSGCLEIGRFATCLKESEWKHNAKFKNLASNDACTFLLEKGLNSFFMINQNPSQWVEELNHSQSFAGRTMGRGAELPNDIPNFPGKSLVLKKNINWCPFKIEQLEGVIDIPSMHPPVSPGDDQKGGG